MNLILGYERSLIKDLARSMASRYPYLLDIWYDFGKIVNLNDYDDNLDEYNEALDNLIKTVSELNDLLIEINGNHQLFPNAVMSSNSGLGTQVQNQETEVATENIAVEEHHAEQQNTEEQLQLQQRFINLQFPGKSMKLENPISFQEPIEGNYAKLEKFNVSHLQDTVLVDRYDYATLFPLDDCDFYLSENYYKISEDEFSIFDQDLLNKSCEYVLFLKDESSNMKTVIISQHEAATMLQQFKSNNKISWQQDQWSSYATNYNGYLYSISGDNIVKSEVPISQADQLLINKGLFFANLYKGNLHYIAKDKEMLLRLCDSYATNKSLLKDYMVLKNKNFSNKYADMMTDTIDKK